MKLLLDEQISGKVAEWLCDRGHDVLAATAEPRLRGLGDAALFDFAQGEGRALVTYDRGDFEAVLREYLGGHREHQGVAFVHPIRFPSGQLSRLTDALAALLDGPDRPASFMHRLQPND